MQICNNQSQCTGCGLCVDSCPKNAIKLEIKNGFLYPCVDDSLCVNCGLCVKQCPQNNEYSSNYPKGVYVYQTADPVLLRKSSSGGAFGMLSGEIFSRNGVCCGATLDNDLNPVHAVCDNEANAECLHGSKYVQSNIYPVIEEIRKTAKSGRQMLVSGTSCQIAAVKKALGTDYPNVYFVDLVCTGVMSPVIFKSYVNLLEDKYGVRLTNFLFRDKTNGWTKSNIKITDEKSNETVITRKDSEYFTLFGSNIGMRECCYNCRWRDYKSVADLTLGDYWGIESFYPEMKDDRGYSLILVNTDKGAELLKSAVGDNDILKETSLEHAEKTHKKLHTSIHKSDYQNLFMRKFLKDSSPENLKKVVERCCSTDFKNRVLRKIFRGKKG